MNLQQKLETLIAAAADDREALPPRLRNATRAGSLGPLNLRNVRIGTTGPRARLLRVLMTNACSFNCHYCPMRRDRELPRTVLKPVELVRIFLDARSRGWAEGLFITTGIPGRPQKVMDDLIEVLELLRVRHRYAGYIHVKILPGADDAQVDRVTALASRVSLNLETPCGDSLAAIAPDKQFSETLVTLRRAQGIVNETRCAERDGRPRDALRPGGAAGITTQFVVGATPDPDQSLLARAVDLYAEGGVHHVHFSAFRPVRDTPLESRRSAPPLREHRLYQADHLIRRYRFLPGEIVFDSAGNLPLAYDPKVAWALANPARFPVEVRTASYERLLRVPGIGPVAARRIVDARRAATIRSLADLRTLGVRSQQAQGFILIGGRRVSAERWREQLPLWPPDEQAGVPQRVYEFSPGTFR
jgi:predicted DNA-binding helix-hairpin-helix protein